MGEMAEYVLNGDDCEGCGEYLGDGPGFPRRCSACSGGSPGTLYSSRRERNRAKRKRQRRRKAEKLAELLTSGAKDAMLAAGWVQRSTYHWQLRTPAGLIDYWPSSGKWMRGGVVQHGTHAEVMAAVGGVR